MSGDGLVDRNLADPIRQGGERLTLMEAMAL